MGSTRTVTLIGADGTRHVLACSAEPYQLGVASQLWGAAPYAVTSRQLGVIPGERVEQVRALPRNIVVPIQVEGATELEIDQRLAALGAILSPSSELRILYRRADGTERELTGRCVGGADAVQATDRSGYLQRHVRIPLVVRAHYPYWRAVASSTVVTGPTTFLDGDFSLSNVVTITNAGDVPTWPYIILTGGADGCELSNLATGQVLRISEQIPLGSTMRIDTDPRSRSVLLDDAWSWPIDPLSEFWPLSPGPNLIVVRSWAIGSDALGTFTFRHRPDYETC
jgi:hypothetical protein